MVEMDAGDKELRVVLVDDRIVLREGVHAVLEAEEDIVVVAEGATVEEALSYWGMAKPDVAVVSHRLAPALREQINEARIVTVDSGDVAPADLVRAVRGYSNENHKVWETRQMLKGHLLSLVDSLRER